MDRSRLHHTHPLRWFGRVKARANAEQKRSHPLTQSGSLHDASHHVVGNDGLAALGSRQSLMNFIRKYFSASQGPLVGSRAHAQLCVLFPKSDGSADAAPVGLYTGISSADLAG